MFYYNEIFILCLKTSLLQLYAMTGVKPATVVGNHCLRKLSEEPLRILLVQQIKYAEKGKLK